MGKQKKKKKKRMFCHSVYFLRPFFFFSPSPCRSLLGRPLLQGMPSLLGPSMKALRLARARAPPARRPARAATAGRRPLPRPAGPGALPHPGRCCRRPPWLLPARLARRLCRAVAGQVRPGRTRNTAQGRTAINQIAGLQMSRGPDGRTRTPLGGKN